MKALLQAISGLAFAACSLGAAADVATDLTDGVPFLETVENAKSDGLTPEEATRALIDAGQPPARAAYGVASVWNDCQATQEAVMVAAVAAEDEVEPIITTLAGLRSCGCSAESAWARARQDTRLRPEGFLTLPIELSDACSCVTAAVEAAVMSVPQKADRIVRAAVQAAQFTSPVIDSVGQRFDDEERLFESSLGEPEPAIFRRKPDACDADIDELDEFDSSEYWVRGPGGDYLDVGRYETDCDDGDFDDLVITEFNAERGTGNYIEIYNGTGETIDLNAGDYRLSLYFVGLDRRGTSIPLMGPLAAGQTYVIADSEAPDAVLRRTDLVVPQVDFMLGDTMTLHSGWGEENCQCAEAVVAGSLRAPDRENLEQTPQQTEMVRNKVSRIYGQVPDLMPGQVVDAIGQVDWHNEYTAGTPILSRLLRRDPAACRGDSNELDAFRTDPVFTASEEPDLSDAGQHSTSCRSAQIDLVISEFVAADDDVEAIELHNPTPADIDLTAGGYVLELYRPGDETPYQTIDLRGNIEGDGSFLVATAEALRELENEADITVNTLDADESSAVVLKKLNVPSPQRCSVPVAAALDFSFGADFLFVSSPRDPARRPPPVVVDPIASPN